jgi:hypothetical protein
VDCRLVGEVYKSACNQLTPHQIATHALDSKWSFKAKDDTKDVYPMLSLYYAVVLSVSTDGERCS